MDAEALQEFDESLADMLRSRAWRVCARSMQERQKQIARRIAMGKRMPEAEVREAQSQYLLLEEILNNPFEFFSLKRVVGEGG